MKDAVSSDMQHVFKQSLDQIEGEEDVRILCAIEPGSRIWGFHSEDSDHKVRFDYTCTEAW